MNKIEWRRRTIGFTLFRWGIYLHLRWKLRWWHLKTGLWVQRGLRADSRRAVKRLHKTPRYVTAIRFNVSFWTTRGSTQGRSRVFGVMFYGGRTP